MKTYVSPKTKVVQLDPDQAILQICAVEGIFLRNGADTFPYCGRILGTTGPICTYLPKGGTGGGTPMSPRDLAGDATDQVAPS
ncbi:MAG: hypothetical protein PHQ52_01835 [Candidatus Omnitrophica bacterium]|nr:hypothetical protein [Candidatus Omnitrophota bacterium]